MARVPVASPWGPNPQLGVGRPDRSVSLPSPELQRAGAGFDFDEFDAWLERSIGEASAEEGGAGFDSEESPEGGGSGSSADGGGVAPADA